MTQNFFARYEAASKGNDFSNISLHSDADSLFNKINNVREVCARIYNQDKKHLNVLYNEIKNHHSSKSNQQHITSNQSKSISDSVLDEEVSSPNFFTQSADDILDLS